MQHLAVGVVALQTVGIKVPACALLNPCFKIFFYNDLFAIRERAYSGVCCATASHQHRLWSANYGASTVAALWAWAAARLARPSAWLAMTCGALEHRCVRPSC